MIRTIAVFVENRPFFGALLVHLPLLQALRERHPGARIVLLAPFVEASLLVRAGAADEAVAHAGRLPDVRRRLRALAPDLVLNLRPASRWLDLAVALAGAPRTLGFDSWLARRLYSRTAPHDTRIYRPRKYLTLLMERDEALAAPLGAFLRAGVATAAASGPPTLAVLPGGGAGDFKRWGVENFLALCDALAAEDGALRFAWVLGPQETALRARIAASPLAARSDVLYNLPLPALAAAGLRACAAVGNDCGPGHVFQMCGCPFACVVSDHDGKGAIRADEWLDAANRPLATLSPAGRPIAEVGVDDVLEKVRAVLAAGVRRASAARAAKPA